MVSSTKLATHNTSWSLRPSKRKPSFARCVPGILVVLKPIGARGYDLSKLQIIREEYAFYFFCSSSHCCLSTGTPMARFSARVFIMPSPGYETLPPDTSGSTTNRAAYRESRAVTRLADVPYERLDAVEVVNHSAHSSLQRVQVAQLRCRNRKIYLGTARERTATHMILSKQVNTVGTGHAPQLVLAVMLHALVHT